MNAKKNQSKIVTAIAVVLLAAGAALLYWLYFLKPAFKEIGALQGEIAALEGDIESFNEKLDQKAIIENRWHELQDAERLIKTRVPGTDDLPRVMGQLDKLILSSPLQLEALDAAEIEKGERCRFIPVSLKITGSRKNLLIFLKDLEQFPHLVLIDEAAIERADDTQRLIVGFRLILASEEGDEKVGAEEEAEAEEEEQT
ncbi:MAG: type 4a pilus biogenesis protein PilO [Firmicutes bacterium]|nr:type 4a pilus biogenesis protein PilO [Bacillota bacterium]